MAITSVSAWSTTAADNIDIGGIPLSDSTTINQLDNIAREMMAQIKAGVPLKVTTTTDNAIARFDGTSGAMQNSGVTISDTNNLAGVVDFTHTGAFTHDGTAGNITMASTGADITFTRDGGNEISALGGSSGSLALKAYSLLTIGLGASGTEVARFLNSENAFIFGGTTSVGMDNGSATNVGVAIGDGAISAQRNDGASLNLSRRSTTGQVAAFSVTGSQVGSISVDGSSTTYNTTSDYRRKPLWEQLSGFWERLEATNPVRFQWDTGDWARGFIAHEFAVSYPGSVEGEKDAVDAEGKPVYQAMQASTSEVMADVVAALKDLNSRLKEGGL
nr:hypothetical protein [uncultured Devosia sp.]